MSFQRGIIELIGCCVLAVALIHVVPVGFHLSQNYALSGNLRGLSKPSQELLRKIKKELTKLDLPPRILSSLQCRRASKSQEVTCRLLASRRSQALQLSHYLKEVVPAQIGWIPTQALQERTENTRAKMKAKSKEIQVLAAELDELEPTLGEKKGPFEELQNEKVDLEGQILMHKKQLEIIKEAIVTRPTDDKLSIFQGKEKELTQNIDKLNARLTEAREKMTSLGAPFARVQKIEETLPQLRGEIDLARAQIASWEAVLRGSKGAKTLGDPDSFQVAAPEATTRVHPLQNWSHLPWSILLGVFFFGVVRGRRFSLKRTDVFHTAEEVMTETKLELLGQFTASR